MLVEAAVRQTQASTQGTWKVRRESVGSKRAGGWELQREGQQVRRRRAAALRVGTPDATLSAVGGLAAFNAFVEREGVDRELRRQFGHLKKRRGVVYPMHEQLRLLIDASVAGAKRVFDFEWLAGDAVFKHLAGGAVPSIDVVYDDLRRFGEKEIAALEALVAKHGLEALRRKRHRELTVDIDTTVEVLFGEQEGALAGPNPRYKGRPSYHPILARIAETDTVVGARLRPGNTGFGVDDAAVVEQWLAAVHRAAPRAIVTVRIDAGGDCAALMDAIDRSKSHFVIKAKLTSKLRCAISSPKTKWHTVDRDAFGRPTRQVAEVDFARPGWPSRYRVVAVRTTERDAGKQVCLWEGLDYSVHAYITNDTERDLDTLVRLYDGRAGVEPLIAELKNGFGIGKVSTSAFDANAAAFLIKLLAYNLLRRWVATDRPHYAAWRAAWIRRACICVPARLLRSSGRWYLRLAPRPLLN
ncbi:MAG TPA: IS1380 family transposase [Caldimonas sp.]|nr:IS1380 family transposase [Caldimonas sp.]